MHYICTIFVYLLNIYIVLFLFNTNCLTNFHILNTNANTNKCVDVFRIYTIKVLENVLNLHLNNFHPTYYYHKQVKINR